MSPHLQRAQMLIQQGRPADAERELGLALGQNPDDAWAHALLGVCLIDRKAFEEASTRGKQAVAIAPDSADIRHLAGRIEHGRNNLDGAERLYSEAIALDPYDPRYFAGRAGVHTQRKHWQEALDDCDSALELDPEETEAINLRSLANRGLGRTDDGVRDVEQALRVDPHDATSHANLGWARLQQGDLKQAETHFREALQIDPELEWARDGVMHTTKAKFPPYRWLIAYFLWMARHTGAVQIAIIAGLWFGSQIVRTVAENHPTAAPLLWCLLGTYVMACVATWIARPLSNAILLLHPFGRLALTRQEKVEAGVVISWLAGGVAILGTAAFTNNLLALDIGFAVLRVWLPVAMAFQQEAKQPRRIMIAAAAVIALLSIFQIGMLSIAYLSPKMKISALVVNAYDQVDTALRFSPLAVLFGANYLGNRNWVDE